MPLFGALSDDTIHSSHNMGRPILPKQTTAKKRSTTSRSKASGSNKRKKSKGNSRKIQQKDYFRDCLLIVLECIGLTALGMAAIVMLLGYFGNRFSGTDVMGSLLPFAAGILGCIILATLLLSVWIWSRKWLKSMSPLLPAAFILGLAILIGCFVPKGHFTKAFGYYRTLVGGKEEAGRVTLAHQVFAAYRRLGTGQVEKMIGRAEPFAKDIEDAADAYDIDPDLLKGLAATESSYLPRKSADGGHGLFQITQIPKPVRDDVDGLFRLDARDMGNSRYNAFLGAATFSYYLKQMNSDLFLGLLAYNIGPANGGLRFIMQQYGATDFITIQPYLLQLPRDYPIRVLSYGLAFRIHRKEGRVLAYEEEKNAMAIQALGIPGL